MGKADYEIEDCESFDSNFYQIFRKKKPVVLKLVWGAVALVLLGFCIYVVYLLLADYFSYPSYNQMESDFKKKLALPAITICSSCPLNKTAMEAHTIGDTNAYRLYSQLVKLYEAGSTDPFTNDTFDELNKLDVYGLFAMDFKEQSILKGYSIFAKEVRDLTSLAHFRYTEYGYCMDINDDEIFEQKVSGPIGGLDIVMDAKTEHYIEHVASTGFQVFLRNPGETVLNKGWGFSVKPGEHAKVNLHRSEVTRLDGNLGDCETSDSLYFPAQSTTAKECFMTNILWYFIKTPLCECWPFYFYERFMGSMSQFVQRNMSSETAEEALMKYWTSTVGLDDRLTIPKNVTCYREYHFNGTYIKQVTNLADATECAEECRKTTDCTAFDYNNNYNASTEFGTTGTCSMYDSTVVTSYKALTGSGIEHGLINCTTQYPECSVYQYELCNNKLIEALMNDSGPSLCKEPCSYNDFTYMISTAEFPSKNYYVETLSNDIDYSTWEEAKANMVKISLYYESLVQYSNTQTASYEIQNFISEFGGTVDLLVGLSVYLFLQILEWSVMWVWYRCCGRGDDGDTVVETNKVASEKV